MTFMMSAPDETYLFHKVILVMGVFGGLRRDELVKMTIDDVTDKGSVLLVNVPETKTATSKSFTIVEENNINALNIVRKYMALRPKGMKRFFLTYRNSRCTGQPVGKNTIGSVPAIIAKYLKLEDAKSYTGHCLRRTSSTLLVEAGATFETLKIHGKWKSSTVAEGYIEDSILSKNKISKMIASSVTAIEKEDSLVVASATSMEPIEPTTTIVDLASAISENKDKNYCENVRSALISGSFTNCNFYLGNKA